MAQIAGIGNTVNRKPGRTAPPKPASLHDAIFQTPARPAPRPVPVRRVAPAKSPVFGPIGPAGRAQAQGGQQIQRAVHRARRAEQRIQASVPNPSVPEHPIALHPGTIVHQDQPGFLSRLVHDVTHPGQSIVGTSNVTTPGRRLPGATASPGLIAGAPTQSLPALVLKNTAIATYEHPGAVLGHTATGLASIIAGTPAGIGELVGGTVGPLATGHPERAGQAIGRMASAFGSDLSRRYGPLVSGNEKAFRQRIVKEGVAPELLDTASLVGGGGAVAGRAIGEAARAGSLGETLGEIASAPRPLLRTSGDLAREQELSPNIFRATAQRGEDALRQRVTMRRNRGEVARGIQPRPIEGPAINAAGAAPRGAGEVVPLVQNRAVRVAISKVSSRSHLRNRREQAQKISHGIERTVHDLNPTESKAVFHTTSGLLPLHGTADDIRNAVVRRRAQIIDEHRAPGATDEQVLAHIQRNHPQILRDDREFGALNFIHDHADQIAQNPKLIGLHQQTVNLSRELSALDPGLKNLTAERHPYRVQGHALGIKYDPPKETAGLTGDAFQAAKTSHDKDFIARVRAAADQQGLPTPAFFHHQAHSVVGHADRTAGNVGRAIAGPKESALKLFRQGRVYTGPDVLISGLAKNIKRRHQWEGVATAFEQHALPWSRSANGQGKSPGRLLEEMDKRGLNPADYTLVNMGRFHAEARSLGQAAEGSNRLEVEAVDPERAAQLVQAAERGDPEGQAFVKQTGMVAVPREAANELQANLRAPKVGTRIAGKVQGISSAAILGLSPSWLQMQVAANALLTGIGTHGNAKDLLANVIHGDKLLENLSPEARQHLEDSIGVGAFEGHTQTPHLGSVADRSKMLQHVQRLGQTAVTVKGRTLHLADANPTRAMFRMDNAQNNLFRKTVLYNAAKRQAYTNLRRETGAAAAAQARVANLLRLRPGEDVSAQIDRVLHNPQEVEKLAEHTNNILGDYLRFTSHERNTLKPAVMFYGFLRYALKTLFYTLPVKHPIAAAIAGKVGQLHDEEIRHIFGTRDVPPWVFSRLFKYNPNGSVKRNKQGQIESIDLARINPVSSPLTDIAQESQSKHGAVLSPALGMLNPMAQILMDQAYARNSFSGKGFVVHGSAEENPAPDLVTRGRIVLNQIGSMASPYRLAEQLTQPGTQGDDTLLGSPRPIKYKTAGTQAQEAQRRANRPSAGAIVGQQTAPFFFPKGDTTEDYLKRHPPQGGVRAGKASLPGGVTQAELDHYTREAQQQTGGGQVAPGVTQAELDYYIRQATK